MRVKISTAVRHLNVKNIVNLVNSILFLDLLMRQKQKPQRMTIFDFFSQEQESFDGFVSTSTVCHNGHC
jgi:hypothetical protein